MAELRRDPVTGNWCVVGYTIIKRSSLGTCPFCPGNENLTPPKIKEIKNEDGSWAVRCFPASNPIFIIEAQENKRAEGIYDKMDNVGAHEIIVENPNHNKTMSAFTEKEFINLVDLYKDRILDLKKDKRFKYILIFKNHGELAGSYIFHPHSHVLATPIIPQRLGLEFYQSRIHFSKKERCLFCDIISQEIRQNKRVVAINNNFLAFCPFASRFPFEVWIIPRYHSAHFENPQEEDKKIDFISIFTSTMKRIERLTNAYTIVIHTSPNMMKIPWQEEALLIDDYFHWHIEIMPRDLRSSKYKREDEFYVVPTTPEESAMILKSERV
ncbi:MAG TPA: DUF4931 domain-containing protein [Syntrophorhabdaceae bacterium]|nr:DUF4931 domain-containing protein [Syntrophorhabdaceae bacterium]